MKNYLYHRKLGMNEKVSLAAFKALAQYYSSLLEGDTHNIERALVLIKQVLGKEETEGWYGFE